jgi:hypothetical protein
MNTRELRTFPVEENTQHIEHEGGCNPFHHDLFRMGTRIGSNCIVMFEHHEHQNYIIVCNTVTGDRLAVELDANGRMTDMANPFHPALERSQ